MAQRRKINGDDIQAIEKILAEFAFTHELPQIHVCSRDDTNINLNFIHSAQVHEPAVLQHPQNLGLRFQPHRSDFVEEQRSAMGDLEESLLRRNGAGECTFNMAEQSGFQQIRRH